MALTTENPDDLRARPASEPIVFGGTIGLFEAARGLSRRTAVLFARPWGMEEICTHRFFRLLAERFADEGVASLRLDYPGTGDALSVEQVTLAAWEDSLIAAAAQLRDRSGCERLIIVAQGLGALVASRAARAMGGVAAAALLAPVVSGRAHVRELAAFFNVGNERLRLHQDRDRAEIAAILLPPVVAETLKKVDLLKIESAPAPVVTVFTREDRPSDSQFAGHLRGLGAEVSETLFDGYDRLTFDPLAAEISVGVVLKLTDWVVELAGPRDLQSPPVHPRDHGAGSTPYQEGQDFREKPVRFGNGNRLYGMLCSPRQPAEVDCPPVLLLAAGYERMAGWGGVTARTARALAARGITSLRFDCSNVADSPPVDGHGGQVLYSDIQVHDAREALSFLSSSARGPVMAAGLCSGAYLAYQVAVHDERVSAIVGINPEVFVWPEERSVDEALKGQIQTLEHYGKRLVEMESLRKLLRGDVNLVRKGWEIGVRVKQHALRPLSKVMGGLSVRERAVHRGFQALQARNMPVALLYSVGDIGLEEFSHFLRGGRGRPLRYRNIGVTLVPDANHTFMQNHARRAYVDAIIDSAARIGRK